MFSKTKMKEVNNNDDYILSPGQQTPKISEDSKDRAKSNTSELICMSKDIIPGSVDGASNARSKAKTLLTKAGVLLRQLNPQSSFVTNNDGQSSPSLPDSKDVEKMIPDSELDVYLESPFDLSKVSAIGSDALFLFDQTEDHAKREEEPREDYRKDVEKLNEMVEECERKATSLLSEKEELIKEHNFVVKYIVKECQQKVSREIANCVAEWKLKVEETEKRHNLAVQELKEKKEICRQCEEQICIMKLKAECHEKILEQHKSELDRANEDWEGRLEEEKMKRVLEVMVVKKELEENVKFLEREKDILTDSYDEKFKFIMKEKEIEMKEADNKYQEKINMLAAKYNESIQLQSDDYKKQLFVEKDILEGVHRKMIESLEKNWTEKLQEAEAKASSLVNRQQELKRQMANECEDWDQTLQIQHGEWENFTKAEEERHKEKLGQLKKEHDLELQWANVEWEEKIEEEKTRGRNKLDESTKKHESDVGIMVRGWEEMLQLERSRAKEIDDASKHWKSVLEEERNRKNKRLEERCRELETQISEMEAENEKMCALRLSEMKRKHKIAIRELVHKHEGAVEVIKEECERKVQEMIRRHETEVYSQAGELENKREQQEEEVQTLRQEIDSLKQMQQQEKSNSEALKLENAQLKAKAELADKEIANNKGIMTWLESERANAEKRARQLDLQLKQVQQKNHLKPKYQPKK